MQSSIKSQRPLQLRLLQKEFLAMMVEDVGKGAFRDCEKEEFQELEEKGGEEFYLQEEEQEPVQSIKTAPFNKFLNMGVQKIEEQPEVQLDQLTVDSYNFAFGCNEGRAVEMVEGKVCRAIGVNIFLDGFIYPSQVDRNDFNAHSYQICYLRYDSNSQLLYSGSNGRSSEIIQWQYRPKEKSALIFKRKVTLPSSSLGVGFTFKLSGLLFCISKWSLHKQAQLFGFDQESTKRTRFELQLGKVVGLCEALDVYLINERGLHMLAEAENGFELVKITQSQQYPTALDKVGSEYLLVGLIDGSVEVVNPKNRTIINKFSVANSPILAVKMVYKHTFVAATSEKSILSFQLDAKMKQHKILDRVELTQISRNILVEHNGFTCCLKGGKMESFEFHIEGKLSRTTNTIEEIMAFPKAGVMDQRICYNKAANKYFYFTKGSDSITIFQIDSKGKISKTNIANLTHSTHLLDSHGTIMAAIQSPKQKHPSDPISQVLEFYDFIQLKSICIMQELPIKQCTCIKFNQDGDKLALGFANGHIIILNTNVCKAAKQICRTQGQIPTNFTHQTPIQNIIWSNDGKYLKTLSRNHLLFYGITRNNDESYSLTVYDGKKTTETMKNALVKANWSLMGRFNWRTSKVWSRANSVDQYVDIVEIGSYLFASLDSGDMEVFTNPAGQEYHALCRWFTCPYQLIPVEQAEGMVLLVAGKGALMSVNIR